jgi:hypothetical protein
MSEAIYQQEKALFKAEMNAIRRKDYAFHTGFREQMK